MRNVATDLKIVVHLHLHYTDLLELMIGYLKNIPVPFDLIVTITDPDQRERITTLAYRHLPGTKIIVIAVTNLGRDVKPFYTDIASMLLNYDLVCHVHGKKSSFNKGATAGWLEYLMDSLMGSPAITGEIIRKFQTEPGAGIIYPPIYHKLPYWANTWLSNSAWADRLQRQLNIPALPASYFSYPVGNMFWARVEAIRPLLTAGFKESDYPAEPCGNDGEIMHALERMITVVARSHGYENYIIQITKESIHLVNDASAVDLSGYHASNTDHLENLLATPAIKVVSFDIFDTLIMRALIEPADLFELMAPEVDRLTGKKAAFRRVRIEADAWVRKRLTIGTDVTLARIYDRIAEVLQLEDDIRAKLMARELELESIYLIARPAVVEALQWALSKGKRVVLVSDMYLPEEFVKSTLHKLGITGYHQLYLSSTLGRRKDNRTLFPYLLEQEGVDPHDVLHIGDNEHSDLQVPSDLGIDVYHIMRPKELFSHTTVGRETLTTNGHPTFFSRLSLGSVLTQLFDHPFPQPGSLVRGDLRRFGYFYFGPVLLAFVKWVMDTAIEDKVKTLYFLSRDGEILLKIYRLLQEYIQGPTPEGIYLEVSRRSIGVPFIEHSDQLEAILAREFYGGTLQEYFKIRLGFDLAKYPGINVKKFGFHNIQKPVYIPADMRKVKALATHIWENYTEHFAQEKSNALGYLQEQGLFKKKKKAIVDIGYSGTMQRMLNDVPAAGPIHGYYMVLYSVIDSLIKDPAIQAKGLFGHKIDAYLKQLSLDKYSLFYEMILSSAAGSVLHYDIDAGGRYQPVPAPVSEEEKYKIAKLPLIHEGIMSYCRDMLSRLPDTDMINPDDHHNLLFPFRHFLENPTRDHIEMLAGYSLDDDYCGNGILYWAPRPEDKSEMGYAGNDFLWKKIVPDAAIWSGADQEESIGSEAAIEKQRRIQHQRVREISDRYMYQYDSLPDWYKKIGHIFKILRGTKRVRIILEDVNYTPNQSSKAEEIQSWYNKEYEILPAWYRRFGRWLKRIMLKLNK